MEDSTTSALVTLQNVTVSYGSHHALNQISLTIPRGTHWVITGRNGAGKSTLLRLIKGEVRPDQTSSVPCSSLIWNINGSPETTPLMVRKHIAVVTTEMQENYLRQQWKLTGEECLLSGIDGGPMLYRISTPEEQEQVHILARQMGIAELLDMELPAMSQGQLRRTLMGRALMGQPSILILDEVCEGLDKSARTAVLNAADRAAETGVTLLFVSHRHEELPACITHQVTMEKGSITYCGLLAEGTPQSIRRNSTSADPTAPEELQQVVNHAFPAYNIPFADQSPPYTPQKLTENIPIFLAHQADVFIERHRVLHSFNWRFEQGESWSVCGSNGAGKSTLLRLLSADERQAHGGTVTWFGETTPNRLELHARLGIVSDKLQATYGHDKYHSSQIEVTAEELVWSGFTQSIGMWDWRQVSYEQKQLAAQWITWFGLYDYAKKPMRSLSYGLLRRFLLCRAVAHSPNLLLLDEACSGLDAVSRRHFLSTLRSLAKAGMHLVYVTHRQEEIIPEITHDLLLDSGRVLYCGSREKHPLQQ